MTRFPTCLAIGSPFLCCDQMDHQPANPYAPPDTAALATDSGSRDDQLRPLWIWLSSAIVLSLVGSPAELISIAMALAHGLVSFWVGVVLGSSLNVTARVVLALLLFVLAITLLIMASMIVIVGVCYLIVSILTGAWATRRLVRGRLRILSCFSLGYVLGSMMGPLGTVGGAVVGTLFAKRTVL